MIYLYDQAIVKDLERSLNTSNGVPAVKVVDPEGMTNLTAQVHNDEVSYPIIGLTRVQPISLDQSRMNFSLNHGGIRTVFDKKTNTFYYERSLPIDLKYDMTVITTNQVENDELVKELLFKYLNMFFLTIDLPYEAKRTIRFGVSIDSRVEIEQRSGTYQYLSAGSLYQTSIPIFCTGCVELSYRPVVLQALEHQIEAVPPGLEDLDHIDYSSTDIPSSNS